MVVRLLIFIFALLKFIGVSAQQESGPVARFDFNSGGSKDPTSGITATMVGASFCPDRFGNDQHAAYVFGNEFSYIDFGPSGKLKNRVGTISLWVRTDAKVWSGKGFMVNPILIIKCREQDDFFEALGIYYQPDTRHLAVCATRDSLRQISITSLKEYAMREWHHIVISWDDRFLSLYRDGQLEQRIEKKFRSQFLNPAHILAGVTGNKKNNRFSQASIDDVLFYDRVLTGAEVRDLYTEEDPNKARTIRNRTLMTLAVMAAIALIYFFVRWQLGRKHKKERERLEIEKQRLETELRVNRSLMDPHFVFNSMYSLQSFILKEDYLKANEYLVKFSKLLRKILESNMQETITLDVELDLLTRYLEIENMRFEKNIQTSVEIGADVIPSVIRIPVMMLQPFVENSVWHGLQKKEGEKRISMTFSIHDKNYLRCTIDDNGIGRSAPIKADAEKNPLATGFVLQRLRLLNEIHGMDCRLEITDKPSKQGTTIQLDLPIINNLS